LIVSPEVFMRFVRGGEKKTSRSAEAIGGEKKTSRSAEAAERPASQRFREAY